MKKKILMSIHPDHVQNILSGIKKYEYRKTASKQELSSMLIYETWPTMKVVAEVEIISVVSLPPTELWNLTRNESGIDKVFFDDYFKDKSIAHAYKLGRVKIFEKPRSLSSYGVKNAPQSFVYIG